MCHQQIYRIFAIDSRLSPATPKEILGTNSKRQTYTESDSDIRDFIYKCEICNEHKGLNHTEPMVQVFADVHAQAKIQVVVM